MIATDGLFVSKKLDLPVSKELGEWEETVHEDGIFIVQPGIYFTGAEAKSRGIERGNMDNLRTEFQDAWSKRVESRGHDYTVKVPVKNFITAKQALARGKWKLAGTWEDALRDISYYWYPKRITGLVQRDDRAVRSFPRFDPDLESVGYGRVIGGGLIVADDERYGPQITEQRLYADNPDWMPDPLFALAGDQ
jgi:hypothetical protein